ncbi:hypothetical protein HG536_0B00100 [Torulaspora globosa]|uniref:Uncharacterized protein n=1 Tax=Torulaspora globosa TaxID=48254 RepID=A0A7G3ZCB6_9SACH|nr:uncharacterized protein HG536_0B00100 [Torulaspora globosa]QLL31152.1 hypothetical protein HG536_0B00100 [Torulaspora globosa]
MQVIATLPRTFLVTSYHAGHCHITPDIPHDVLSCTTMATYPEHSSRRHIMQKFGMLPPDFPYHAGSCRTLPYRSLSAVIALGVFALRRYRNPPRISLPTEYCPCYPRFGSYAKILTRFGHRPVLHDHNTKGLAQSAFCIQHCLGKVFNHTGMSTSSYHTLITPQKILSTVARRFLV